MQLSVICTEDGSELKADPADDGTLLGNDFADYLQRAVRGLAEGHAPGRFPRAAEPATCRRCCCRGEFDPVTPPRYGDDGGQGACRTAATWCCAARATT